MAKTKELYNVPSGSPDLNFILARISDRLDKIEGLRGEPQIEESLEVVEVATMDDDDGAGTRIKADAKHESAPASSIGEGEWEITVYDDGTGSPVFRVRYREDDETLYVGDLPLL